MSLLKIEFYVVLVKKNTTGSFLKLWCSWLDKMSAIKLQCQVYQTEPQIYFRAT